MVPTCVTTLPIFIWGIKRDLAASLRKRKLLDLSFGRVDLVGFRVYALRILKNLLTICHSTIHVMYKGSYRYMHFLATLSKIKWYSELVIHTIHAAFFPRPNDPLCLSCANTHPWTSALLCYFLYFLAVAIAFILYHIMSIHLQNFKWYLALGWASGGGSLCQWCILNPISQYIEENGMYPHMLVPNGLDWMVCQNVSSQKRKEKKQTNLVL